MPRYEFIKREISWQSPVFFTPVDKMAGGLKEAELKSLIFEQYQAAGIAPESVDSGAIIITGESAKTRNASPGGDDALPSRWAILSSPAPGRISNP